MNEFPEEMHNLWIDEDERGRKTLSRQEETACGSSREGRRGMSSRLYNVCVECLYGVQT